MEFPRRRLRFADRATHALGLMLIVLAGRSDVQGAQAAQDPADLPPLTDYTIHVMAQSHMDPVWRWRLYEGHDLIHDTFAQAVRFIDERDDFIFNQSYAWMYARIERTDPELFAAINKAVRAGRWCVVGGTWVEADQNLTGGEAMVRQHLCGQRYFREAFGVTAKVGWNVDAFGHAWSLPQIMAKSGLTSDVITRCGPGEILSDWQGPDGSTVMLVDVRALLDKAGDTLGGIKSPAQIFGIMPKLRVLFHEVGLKHLFAATVVGDHGGGPTRRELAIFDAIGQMKRMPKIVMDSADHALETIRKSAGDLPTHRDELNYVFRGCYTSQAEIKRRNRTDEQWLTTAEKACVLASLFGKAEYPQAKLRGAWHDVLFNQFHDILPGTSIRRVQDDVDAIYDRAENTLEGVTETALQAIADSLDTRGEGQPVVVVNPLSWKRDDLASVILDYKYVPSSVRIRDAEGRTFPGQVVGHMKIYESFERCRIVFVARDVPPVGASVLWVEGLSKSGRPLRTLDHFDVPVTEELYKAYREKGTYWKEARPAKPAEDATLFAEPKDSCLENARYRVVLNGKTGHVAEITDRKSKRNLLKPGESGNRLELIEEAGGADAWRLKPTDKKTVLDRPSSISWFANGPVMAGAEVRYVHGNSVFEQRIALYDGLDRIDMTNQTEWRERNTMLKVRWPIAAPAEGWAREIPYAWITKPMDGQEVPAQRWVDVSGDTWGVSLLNDGRYGHDCQDGDVGLTLLRSSTKPDPVADVGIHAVTYSLWAHDGPWKPEQTVRRAAELNAPLMARAVAPHAGSTRSCSLLRVDPANVIVSAVKRDWDGKGWVVRLWETSGKPTDVTLTLCRPIRRAEETDLIEDRVGPAESEGAKLTFRIGAHEIKTFRVEL